jgi:hypothetical protein
VKSSKWDFFIAYASNDVDIALHLYDLLSNKWRVFIDKKEIIPGDDFDRIISDAQLNSRISVLLISSSVENAYYLREEITTAIALSRKNSQQHRVIPVFIDGIPESTEKIPYGLRIKEGIDARQVGGIKKVANELDKIAISLGVLPGDKLESPPSVGANKRFQLYEDLSRLSPEEFEKIITRLSLTTKGISNLSVPQATRAIEIIHMLDRDIRITDLEEAIKSIRSLYKKRFTRIIGNIISRLFPKFSCSIVSKGWLNPPSEFRPIRDYLKGFAEEMATMNRSGLASSVVVPLHGGDLPGQLYRLY